MKQKKLIKWIIIFLIILVSLFIFKDAFRDVIRIIDNLFYELLVQKLRNDNLTKLMKMITILGSAYVLIPLAITLVIISKNKKKSLTIPINLTVFFLFNAFLKLIIRRTRPFGYNLVNETGYSFPSGHSAVSTAFYGLLIYLIYKKIKNKYLKGLLISFLSIIILLIGFSRVYLGVHYASDVIAGFIVATIYLIAFTKIIIPYFAKN